jgi:hypothetical protein
MKTIHGMCFDCVIQMEHELKLSGGYKDYEKEKMLSNMKSWFKQAEIEKEALKAGLKTKFVNEDGSFEELNEKIENEFRIFKENYIQKVESR